MRGGQRVRRLVVRDVEIEVEVNGTTRSASVPPRLTLADFLRDRCGLTGTHLGCEHGVCGACTVLLDGEAVRSCLVFAVQASGRGVDTGEGLANGSPRGVHPPPAAVRPAPVLQCGVFPPGGPPPPLPRPPPPPPPAVRA